MSNNPKKKITNGDVIVVVESLLSKGFIKESTDENGNLIYNIKNIVDGLFIRCMDCNHICDSIEESIKHSEEFEHFRDVNLYKRKQFQDVLKEIMRESL